MIPRPAEERLFGLIGKPLSHSFSRQYFSARFEKESLGHCRYELFELDDIADINGLIAAHDHLEGLNVTIPYKVKVMPYLDHLDETAQATGAVNCIRIRGGVRKGYNTDCLGFEKSLAESAGLSRIKTALVLGNGGAARAVCYILRKHDIRYEVFARTPVTDHEYDINTVGERGAGAFDLIVNTTPLGMYPDTDAYPPIAYPDLQPRQILFDLVYNPAQTLFLSKGKEKGCTTINGLQMLHYQADAAWEIWNQDQDSNHEQKIYR